MKKMKQDKKTNKKKKNYIFNEWEPNVYLIVIWALVYISLIIYVDKLTAIYITISYLLLSYSISFSKRREKRREKSLQEKNNKINGRKRHGKKIR